MVRFVRNGWYYDSYRHSLAARGVSTSNRASFASIKDFFKRKPKDDNIVIPPDSGDSEETSGTITYPGKDEGGNKVLINKNVKFDASGSTANKQRQEEEKKKIAKNVVLEPYEQRISRVRSGVLSDIKPLLDEFKDDPQRMNDIRNAVFQGATEVISKGQSVDWDSLRKSGLSGSQLNNLDQMYREAQRGSVGALRSGAIWEQGFKKTVGAAGGVAGHGLAVAETVGSVGLKNMMEAPSQPEKSAYEEIIEANAKRNMEQVATKGLFNPLKIAGIDVDALDQKAEAQKRVYSKAERAKQETESFYSNSGSLAKIDLSGFNKGNVAFQSGNRDKLIDAITDLEAEHGKIKDRWNMLQDTRRLVLSPENRDQTIHKAAHQGGVFPSIALGTGGADEISRETEKISQVERKLKDSSNILSARIGILRNKLRRLNSVIPPSTDAPEKVNIVSGGASSGNFFNINALGSMLDANKGKLRDTNII